MEHCVLPELPLQKRSQRHILSHDTVEAALVQQAGYQVWLICEEEGSYEEGPPNLTESLQRDQRWCQGNLQHIWFLFAPGTRFTTRIHMFFGVMSYLASPLCLLFMALSGAEYFWNNRYASLSSQTEVESRFLEGTSSHLLLTLTLILLFLPKVLGLILTAKQVKKLGEKFQFTTSLVLDTLMSVLLAPILMYFHGKFVVLCMFGSSVKWTSQNRHHSQITWGEAMQTYSEPTVLGLGLVALGAIYLPGLLPWVSPILLGWVLSIPLAYMTSSARLGTWTRNKGYFLATEEIKAPVELQELTARLTQEAPESVQGATEKGIARLFLSPYANSVHVSMLRDSLQKSPAKMEYLQQLQIRLMKDGPTALTAQDMMALTSDVETVQQLHREIWQTSATDLHPCWIEFMRAGALREF